MDFIFKHKTSGEIKTVSLTEKQIQKLLEYELYEEYLKCDCEPVGETNVVECNCDDYLCGFKLQDR